MLVRSPLALLVLAVPLSAQVDLFDEAELVHVDWPAGISHLAKGRMVAGDVTGDLLPDLVLLNGSTPVVVYGPAVYRSVFELDIEANDLVLLPDPTPGQAQRLMVVNDDGLHELTGYDAGVFDEDLLTFTGWENWQGATRVTRGDTDGDGSLDLVGLSAGGDLLFLEDIETSPTHTLLAVGPTILDLAPLDWNGSGTMAVGRLQSNGFRVVTKGNSLLFSVPGSAQSGLVLPIHQEGFGRDRCAVIWTYAGEQYLAVVDSSGIETPIDITSFAAHGVAVGDANGDGDDDLYLVSAGSHTSKLLINRSASESFTYALDIENCETITLASGSPPSGATPWPVACDLTLDGDLDLALFLAASDDCVLLENQSLAVEAGQPADPAGTFFHHEAEDMGELMLTFSVPAGLPFQPTHLQVTAWKFTWPEEGLSIETVAYENAFYPKLANDKAITHIAFDNMPFLVLDFGLVIVVRWVEVDPTDGMVESGPCAVYMFALPKNMTDLIAPNGEGIDVRTIIVEEDPPWESIELSLGELTERELAPKEVPAPVAPPMQLPPDPFP